MATCVLSCLLCFNKCPRIPFLGCEKELVRTLVESTFAKKKLRTLFFQHLSILSFPKPLQKRPKRRWEMTEPKKGAGVPIAVWWSYHCFLCGLNAYTSQRPPEICETNFFLEPQSFQTNTSLSNKKPFQKEHLPLNIFKRNIGIVSCSV